MKLPGRWFHGAASGVAVAAALWVLASLGGCQSKDSLILVTVSAADDSYATGLRSLVVTCGNTTQVFHLPSAISTTEVTVGLYVPSSTTGSQTVKAQAVGTACGNGYAGSTTVHIASAGATVSGTITMIDARTCPSMGGGATGTGGTGGNTDCTSSAQPPAGTPPKLVCCIEYDQDTPEVCSDSSGNSGTEIDAVAFSPDGKTLVSAGGTAGNDVKVWSFDGHTLTDTGTVLPSDGWLSLAFSADGSLLAVPVSGGVDLWNTSNWTLKTTLFASSNSYGGAQFTPDQKHLIAIDADSSTTPITGNLYVFDLTSAATELIPVDVVALSADPTSLAVAAKAVNGQVGVAVSFADGTMDVFSYANGTVSARTTLQVDAAGATIWNPVFSPDGTLVAIGDTASTVHFWTFPVPASLAEAGSDINFSTYDSTDIIYALAFSPNGSYLAAGGGDDNGDSLDSNASLFTVSTRALLARANSSHDVTSIAFSPSGNAVAGGEIDCGKVFVCTN
jgi:WD40 repeat protein